MRLNHVISMLLSTASLALCMGADCGGAPCIGFNSALTVLLPPGVEFSANSPDLGTNRTAVIEVVGDDCRMPFCSPSSVSTCREVTIIPTRVDRASTCQVTIRVPDERQVVKKVAFEINQGVCGGVLPVPATIDVATELARM